MKRGRRADDYEREEFCKVISKRRRALGYTFDRLEEETGVWKSTLSHIFGGRRPCPTEVRRELARALYLSDVEKDRFVNPFTKKTETRPFVLLDPPYSPYPHLDNGQLLLVCSCFREAQREFLQVFKSAGTEANLVLQADAAARLSWLYDAVGEYNSSDRWGAVSARLIEVSVGAPLEQIIKSARQGFCQDLSTSNREALNVLTRTLQTRDRVIAQRIIYKNEYQLREIARKNSEDNRALFRYLQVPAAIGHDLAWQAAVLSTARVPDQKAINKLLDESQDIFGDGTHGDAFLARHRGVVGWHSDAHGRTRQFLEKAIDRLAAFGDAGALAIAFHILSKFVFQAESDVRLARRYALAGAALHPYGYILKNVQDLVQEAPKVFLRREIDDLLSGHAPFEALQSVLGRHTHLSGMSVEEKLRSNLQRAVGSKVTV